MYNTANNIEDLDIVEELCSYDTICGLDDHHIIVEEEYQDADFLINVRDFTEFEKIQELLNQFGYKAYVTDDDEVRKIGFEPVPVPPIEQPIQKVLIFQFENLIHWGENEQRVFREIREKNQNVIAVDTEGFILTEGTDYGWANKRGTFPVRVYALIRVSHNQHMEKFNS